MKVSTIKEQGNKVIESISEPASPSEGTLWLDLNNTNIHPVINSGNLVEKKVITADCSSIEFTGLNSLVDGDYFLVCHVNMAGACNVSLTVNDNATATNYYTNTIFKTYGTSSVEYGHVNGNMLFGTSLATRSDTSLEARIARHPNGYVRVLSQFNDFPTNSMRSFKRDLTTSFTVTSIQKLSLIASAANGFEAGSVFYLYKQNAAAQLVPYNPIDISSRTSDYYLKPGEIVYRDFTAATTVPLNIATVEGEYELAIIGNGTNTTYTASPTYLRPNNTTYDNAFSYLEYGKEISTSDAGGSKTLDSYGTGSHSGIQIAYQQLLKCNYIITTYTTAKCITGSHIRKSSATAHVFFRNQAIWENTTTPWTSLGTIEFPFAHSGKIIIKRII